MFGLAVLAETDLVSAYPRRFLAMHGGRFGVVGIDAPIRLGHFNINSIVPKVALMDAGLAWLVGCSTRPEMQCCLRVQRKHWPGRRSVDPQSSFSASSRKASGTERRASSATAP